MSQVKHHIRLLQLRLSFNTPRLDSFSPGENITRREQRGRGRGGRVRGVSCAFVNGERPPLPPERTKKRSSLTERKVQVRGSGSPALWHRVATTVPDPPLPRSPPPRAPQSPTGQREGCNPPRKTTRTTLFPRAERLRRGQLCSYALKLRRQSVSLSVCLSVSRCCDPPAAR